MTPDSFLKDHFIRRTPLLRLLPGLITGILLHWYFQIAIGVWTWLFITSLLLLISLFVLPLYLRYRLPVLTGILSFMLMISNGGLLTCFHNPGIQKNSIEFSYKSNDRIVITILEPFREKANSFQTKAGTLYLIRHGEKIPATGKLMLYIRKNKTVSDSTGTSLPAPGSMILIRKSLQPISDSRNPGAFNYKKYLQIRAVNWQVFLDKPDYFLLPDSHFPLLTKSILEIRKKILDILKKNLRTQREKGLAEALLIGYKDDLDKELVQSYSNTGVVHIIAISGLHLGLIYILLAGLLKPLRALKKFRWIRPIFILSGLWLFSLLTGAQASVLRSAFMFSMIVLGESSGRKTSVFNSLAFSALILLCINPYWLWDTGFQLSYAAVTSILLFRKPVYHWFYFSNRLVDTIWKLTAVTLSAQVLTLPLCIYYFHQFPTFFILSNLLVIPMASIILIGEIVLCLISPVPILSNLSGQFLTMLIRLMNKWVQQIEKLPGSRWEGLQISTTQTLLLYLAIAGIGWWLLQKQSKGLIAGLFALLIFTGLRSASLIAADYQMKIIVYQVPKLSGADLISGRHYFYYGNKHGPADQSTRDMYFRPSRILHRVTEAKYLKGFYRKGPYIQLGNFRIIRPGPAYGLYPALQDIPVDLLLLSGNPRIDIRKLSRTLEIKQIVMDGSVPARKKRIWKTACDSLGIPCHDVMLSGAYIKSLR